VIEALTVQPAGKGKMRAAAFLRGYESRLADSLAPLALGGPA
jgi:hypothetical protein